MSSCLPLVGTKDVGTSGVTTYLNLHLNAKTGRMPLIFIPNNERNEQERINAEADFAAAIEAPNFGTGGAYVVMELHTFVQLIKERIDGRSNQVTGTTSPSFY